MRSPARVLAGVALALAFAGTATASELKPTPAELESELVCPVCETTLDTSTAPVALRMKAFIRARIAAGDTKSEIKAQLVDQFGTAVLAVPPRRGFDLVAWVLPLAGLGLGIVAVGALAWRWSHVRGEVAPADADARLDPALEQRVDDALESFE